MFLLPIFLGIVSLLFNLLLIFKNDKLENEKRLLIKEIDRLDKKIYESGGYFVK